MGMDLFGIIEKNMQCEMTKLNNLIWYWVSPEAFQKFKHRKKMIGKIKKEREQ